MPVIIRELVIRAAVNDSFNTISSQSASAAVTVNAEEREALVKECVEQVLTILEKRKKENF
ncbi:MAG TPA: DUF5908 family protein [Chitinophagaceae bacterium]|jgi:hypothetical protein